MKKVSSSLLVLTVLFLWSSLAVAALTPTQFIISVDSTSHKKFGLYYPVTYKFRLPPASHDLLAQISYPQTTWKNLPEKRRSDLFNGIDAVRFDYAGGFAYVSARFSPASDSFTLRIIDGAGQTVPATFDSIPKFYDDRTAAVSIVLDDWNLSFDHYFDTATRYLKTDNLYFSVAIIAADVNWTSLQQHLDLFGDLMEVASHSEHHACDAGMYAASGYDVETAGSRDAIVANLDFNHKPYVPLYVEPCGYSDDQLQAAVSAANYLVERCSNNFFDSGAHFIAWDPAKGRYGRAAETFDDGVPGDSPGLLTEGNSAFDKIMAMGGIYTLVDHPSKGFWYDNSYLLQHLDYVKGRSDVWYVPFGQLYQYHFLQEMRGSLRIQQSGAPPLQASFTAAPLTGAAPLSVSFTDSSTGSVAAWSWSFGDSTTAQLRNPVHSYSSPGTYLAKLTVSSSDGSGSSTAVRTVTVTPRLGPTVQLSSPANGAKFNAPATITVTATATAGSGAKVTKVDFFAGTTRIGTATTAPYRAVWSNVAPGTYSLTARVTDSLAGVASSAAVAIAVSATLPAPWASTDLGNVGEPGSASYLNGVFNVKGSGVDISGTADSFRYLYKPMTGDGQVIGRVNAMGDTNAFAKAGIMIRQALTAGSAHAMINLTPEKGAEWVTRSKAGATTSSTIMDGIRAPYWVKLVRRGDLFTGYVSADGLTWVPVASSTIVMSEQVYAGFAVTSHDNTTLCSAAFLNREIKDTAPPVVTAFQLPKVSRSLTVPVITFTATDNIGVTGYLITESAVRPSLTDPSWNMPAAGAVTPSAAVGAVPQPLPSPWLYQDVGSVGQQGSAGYDNGTFTIKAGGFQTSTAEDAFDYVYRVTSGDVQVTARVAALQGDCSKGGAGVMVRQSLAADAVNAALALGPDGAVFSSRTVAQGSTSLTERAGLTAPYWVRLVRNGAEVSGYLSADGVEWELVDSAELALTGDLLVGVTAASGASSALCTAIVDQVQ